MLHRIGSASTPNCWVESRLVICNIIINMSLVLVDRPVTG